MIIIKIIIIITNNTKNLIPASFSSFTFVRFHSVISHWLKFPNQHDQLSFCNGWYCEPKCWHRLPCRGKHSLILNTFLPGNDYHSMRFITVTSWNLAGWCHMLGANATSSSVHVLMPFPASQSRKIQTVWLATAKITCDWCLLMRYWWCFWGWMGDSGFWWEIATRIQWQGKYLVLELQRALASNVVKA